MNEFDNMIALFDETDPGNTKVKYVINVNDISYINFENKKIFMSTKSICNSSDSALFAIDISFLSDSQISSLVNALASTKQI